MKNISLPVSFDKGVIVKMNNRRKAAATSTTNANLDDNLLTNVAAEIPPSQKPNPILLITLAIAGFFLIKNMIK